MGKINVISVKMGKKEFIKKSIFTYYIIGFILSIFSYSSYDFSKFLTVEFYYSFISVNYLVALFIFLFLATIIGYIQGYYNWKKSLKQQDKSSQ